MKSILRVGAPIVAASLVTALAAAPAGASTVKPSLHSVTQHVKAADASLVKLYRNSHHSGAARSALAHTRSLAAEAQQEAKYLRSHASAATASTAAGEVALQYDWDLRTFTTMVKSTSGTLQSSLAAAVKPTLAARTSSLSLYHGLLGSLSGTSATTAAGVISGVLGATPGEMSGISGLLQGGALPASVQDLLSQALGLATSALNMGVSELQSLVPLLPSSEQSKVSGLLSQLSSVFAQLEAMLGGSSAGTSGATTDTGTTSTGVSGLPDPTQIIGDVFGLLKNLLGDLSSMLPGTGSTGGSTGSGTTSGTGTPGIGSGLGLGLGGLPGLGSLPGLGGTGGLGGLGGFGGLSSLLGGLLGGFGL